MPQLPGAFHAGNRRYLVGEGMNLFQHHFPIYLLFSFELKIPGFCRDESIVLILSCGDYSLGS
jgi:hypothetical protein